MSEQTLNRERVLQLIEAYGAEPALWPSDERDQAVRLLTASPEYFSEALKAAERLDLQLQTLAMPEPPEGLFDVILQDAPKREVSASTPKTWALPKPMRWPVGAIVSGLMMGLLGGYSYAATLSATYDNTDSVWEAAFGDADLVFFDEVGDIE